MQNKKYYQAPIPFVGQKRFFLKELEQILNKVIKNDGEDWQIIDVFGGSGLLAHTAKQLKPKARVIWNDFDGYKIHLDNIGILNKWKADIYKIITKHQSANKRVKLLAEAKTEVINYLEPLKNHPAFSLRLVSQWLHFSGVKVLDWKYFINKDFYRNFAINDYQADGYLKGVECLSTDFLNILENVEYQTAKTFLILDPPYLITNPQGYKEGLNLSQYLKMFTRIKKPFVFFSSSKSDFKHLFDFAISEKIGKYKDFKNLKTISKKSTMNSVYRYEDNLVYSY